MSRSRLRPYPVTALAVATLVSWTGRLGLAWSDRTLSTTGKVTATVPVLIFVAMGAGLVWVVLRRRGSDLGHGGRRFVRLAVMWTVGYWAVRLPSILVHPSDDRYTVGFKAVHTVLAVVAWALSALAWRSQSMQPAPPAGIAPRRSAAPPRRRLGRSPSRV